MILFRGIVSANLKTRKTLLESGYSYSVMTLVKFRCTPFALKEKYELIIDT